MPPKVKQMIKEQEEQEIFKEFEKLGYEVKKEDTVMVITDYITTTIAINLTRKHYICSSNDSLSFQCITIQEHKLLHKLFELWGWFDE